MACESKPPYPRRKHRQPQTGAARAPLRISIDIPLKCGQIITKTAAGHLMTTGALQPSSNITEQATRCQWLLYTMAHHISARRVPPPSLPCAMPSYAWTIASACRVWHCTAPWHALPMRIPHTYEQGGCNLTYTYTRLL